METTRKQHSLAARIAVLAYGSLTYLFFFVVFCYAIGFVTGLVVPKGIDDGEASPLATALLVNGGILALFAVQHMIMARPAFKRWWTRFVPASMERSTFVLFASAILVLLYVQWRPMTDKVWEVRDPTLSALLTGIALVGFGIVLVATFLIDHFDLFGLKQTIRFFRGREHRDPDFRVPSLYRFARHPLYVGFLIGFWVTPVMTTGHLLFAGLCTGFILVAVRLEERDLVAAHGPAYAEYRRRVPMFLPRLRRSSGPVAERA